jgi:hypothetical protein
MDQIALHTGAYSGVMSTQHKLFRSRLMDVTVPAGIVAAVWLAPEPPLQQEGFAAAGALILAAAAWLALVLARRMRLQKFLRQQLRAAPTSAVRHSRRIVASRVDHPI